jgi:hypothetical protein
MWHAWERGKYVQGIGGKARSRIPLGKPNRRREDLVQNGNQRLVERLWSGFTLLRIGTVGGLL